MRDHEIAVGKESRARQGLAGLGGARHGVARQGKAIVSTLGSETRESCEARPGQARRGAAWQGLARRGKAMFHRRSS